MKEFVVSFRASALQIGMPMFFHISGRASALSPLVGFRKRTATSFRRLMLPFILCYVILIPPWQYIDKEYDWEHPSSFHMKANPISWLVHYYFTSEFLLYFDLAWLWFLPALFAIQLLCTPLFLLAERFQGLKMRYLRATAFVGFVVLFSLVMVCGFSFIFGVLAVLGPASATIIAQFVPLPSQDVAAQSRGHEPNQRQLSVRMSSLEVSGAFPGDSSTSIEDRGAATELDIERATQRLWIAIAALTVTQVATSTGLVLSFGYEEIDPPRADGGHDPRTGLPFLLLCTSFYVHGYFIQRWSQGCSDLGGDRAPIWVWVSRLIGSFVTLLMCMVSSPLGDVETGHFIYPIYSASYWQGSGFGAVYVLGTWTYIFLFGSLFQAYVDNEIHPWLYKHATSSAIVVYIFHWMFLKVFAFWMLTPALHNHNLLGLQNRLWIVLLFSLITFLFAVICSLGIYAGLHHVPRLGQLFGIRA
eukprot:TRINITY_DN12062_c0_g2_i2.p1 TRINITY_DN12062_c0_g2~~TRINITY_DN12062_c0_g2_i2.p1  ORF type:complete len:548 (-),score=30.88 TRINITY_DN12062_c0_g2_i2:140-1558(-)